MPSKKKPAPPAGPRLVDQAYEVVPIDSVRPHPRNVNEGDVPAIAESMRAHGFYGALRVQRSSGYIVAGNHSWRAAKELEYLSVPVIMLDVSDDQALRLMLVDNATARASHNREQELAMLLIEIQKTPTALTGTGFDGKGLDDLLASLEKNTSTAGQGGEGGSEGAENPTDASEGTPVTDGLTDDEEVPDVQADPVTSLGDVWIMGKHRLLCGDSTKREEVDRLTGGAKVDIVITDPPYGIRIVKVKGEAQMGVIGGGKPYGKRGVVVGGGSAGHMYPFGGVKKGVGGGENIVKPTMYAPIANDDNPDTAQSFYRCALECGIKDFIIFGGNYFTAFLDPSPCWIIWDKQNSGNFADVEMAWTSFDRGAKLYPFMWNGLCREGDRKTELKQRVHPTQKPVGLFVKIFADFEFASCFDGFLGSGSVLIACEKTDRACFGMELSRDYCDVIVKRWQNFTGERATLESDGRTFDAIASEKAAEPAAA